MREDIGTIIAKLREKEGYTQEQVCEKICSISHLAKIEQNISVPDPFLLDRLLGRLGKSAEWLEYILSKESYELYKFQYQIQKAVLYHKFEEAESLLKLYAEKKQADKPIHRQFIKQEKAQIMWMRDGETTEILDCLDAAITETVPSNFIPEKKMALSAEELKLLLFRWEICQGTRYERSIWEVWSILDYMEKRNYDAGEYVKGYPYAVILLAKNTVKLTGYEQRHLVECAGKASELLLEKTPLFQYQNRAFELDYELIRNSRLALNMSQEELCEGVCAQETLSRIEKGKVTPSDKHLKLLLKKLHMDRGRIGIRL